jgi:RsiW-degrading membrane proteinase PrsW (M82 family)
MNESATSLPVQALVTAILLAIFLGICWWFTRDDRKVFRIWRVALLVLCGALVSSCIAAIWYWFIPHQVDRHSPLLLTAAFLPIAVLLVWGLSLGIRHNNARKHEDRKT